MSPGVRWLLPVLFGACLLPPPPALADRMPWNQERVAAIANDLAGAIERVKDSLERDPEQASVIQERKRQGVIVDVRRLSSLSGELAARLKAGQGLQETRSIYDAIQTVRRGAREAGRNLLSPDSTAEDIVAARELLERLAAYYEGG